MIRYPYIEKNEILSNLDEINFDINLLIELFNGKNSLENIYTELLSKNFELSKINSLFVLLNSKNLIKDKLILKSDVLSEQKIDKYINQIKTFSLFSQEEKQNSYFDLLYGLNCQEKLSKSKIILLGDSNLITSLNDKLRLIGINDIKVTEEFLFNIEADLLIFNFEKYNENLLIEVLQYCNDNNISFLPVINNNFGLEIGPFYLSNETSCSLCLIDRKKAVVGENYSEINPNLFFNISLGSDIVILEVIKNLTGIAPISLKNRVAHHNFLSGLIKYHPVLKNPSCKICSSNPLKPKRKLWQGII
ncbi:hypothetical protein [Flavobacterium sp. CS20]|uniref:hypothetical protein n=1 Tax=Flavobacterium sp. CS20 TaxID=2775246 RepID=UPI001B3A6D7A|nr:hypothetical protein [Flavobacterium sp. CS20]QTY27132.1 hypothetical protein IGB25_00535 [Flavobacterium sp. CS20]